MPSLLQPRFDAFRFQFPEYMFPVELREKYKKMYIQEKYLFNDPIEFLNQTVVSISFLGMGDGVITQEQLAYGNVSGQTGTGRFNEFGQEYRIDMNRFAHPASEQYYRSSRNPLAMVDKTFIVTFKHTLGFWNYFFMFEAFFYQALRDTESKSLTANLNVEILDSPTGNVISKVVIKEPIIEEIDSIDLSYQKVTPESETFKVKFRFNNIDYQFINPVEEND